MRCHEKGVFISCLNREKGMKDEKEEEKPCFFFLLFLATGAGKAVIISS